MVNGVKCRAEVKQNKDCHVPIVHIEKQISGRTSAFFQVMAKTPDCNERLTIFVIIGNRVSTQAGRSEDGGGLADNTFC